jgi:hypothetical protein
MFTCPPKEENSLPYGSGVACGEPSVNLSEMSVRKYSF